MTIYAAAVERSRRRMAMSGTRVVGLDRAARMVASGRRFADERGLAVEFVETDAAASGLPDGDFDLVHARTLLLNVGNRREILAEIVRIARRVHPEPCFRTTRGGGGRSSSSRTD